MSGEALIGRYFAGRDAQQGLPDLDLKIRPAQVQSQGRAGRRSEDSIDKQTRPGRVFDQGG